MVLANGIISAAIRKSSAAITSLNFRGYEMLRAGYYSMDGGNHYRIPGHCIYSVKTQSPDLIDIGMKSVWRNEAQAFDIEIHYVLQRGATGLYSYAILTHPANYPATGYGEWRMVWKLSPDLMEKIYVDDLRRWTMPDSEDFRRTPRERPSRRLPKSTPARAREHTIANMISTRTTGTSAAGATRATCARSARGWCSSSHEFFNDGPTKQDLTASSGGTLIHFGLDHYNGPGVKVAAGESWQKIYGPFLLYCNYEDSGADACWADAQAQADAEQLAWPYAWLTDNPAYPLADGRGSVSGHLAVHDLLKTNLAAANAWVGLAQPPPDGNWQFESKHYEYWAKAGIHGDFKLYNVRPGTYTLYAFTDGAVGELSKPDVAVTTGKNKVGDLIWNVPHHGSRIAWEIGVPDRTAKEFRHGDNYFHGYVWTNFANEFPNPLDYYVGQSNWKTDWNYAQTRYAGTWRRQRRAVEMADSLQSGPRSRRRGDFDGGHRQRAAGAD